jgi:DNA (cytosine-5)-methyltransferase 1
LGECYKQIGNSVCIPLFQELAIQIREQIFSAFDHQYLSGWTVKQSIKEPIQLKIPGLFE